MKINIPPDRLQNKVAFEFIKDRIFDRKKRNLLDVGGADNILKPFLPKNIKYYSLDVNEKAGKHDFLIDLDKKKIPVKNGFFDIIICLEMLEHTCYPEKVLKELRRVSKEDAIFIFSLPNEYNFLQRLYYLFAIKRKTEKPWKVVEEHLHIQKPRIKDIINLFSDFKIHKIKSHWESRSSSKSKFFAGIDKFIDILAKIYPNLFARHIILMCTKKKSIEGVY